MAADRESTLSLPGAYARDLARALGVAGFWQWWAGQLAGLVPAAPRAAWQRRRTRPVVAFEGARASVWRPIVHDGRLAMSEHAAVSLEGSADEVAAAGRGALAGVAGNGGPSVTLALPARAVLRKQIVLPLAVEENLRQVIGYDLDRHTPFKAEELYFDAVPIDRDPARNVVRVDLATVRRSLVDPLIARIESWGGSVAAISADPPMQVTTSSLNLLPPDRRPLRGPWRRWQFWLPLVLLVVIALAATVLPVWQKREYAIELGGLVDRARGQAAVSETLRANLDRQVDDYNFALERKFGYPPTVQVLDDVTRIMPDDTWLTQLELRTARGKDVTRELSLRGESANAGRLVTVLEDSHLFTQAAPRSPTTKIQPGPGEIFDVGAQLKPLPARGAMPLVIASATQGGTVAPGTANPPAGTAHPAAAASGAAGAPGSAAQPAAAAPANANGGPAQPAAASGNPNTTGSPAQPAVRAPPAPASPAATTGAPQPAATPGAKAAPAPTAAGGGAAATPPGAAAGNAAATPPGAAAAPAAAPPPAAASSPQPGNSPSARTRETRS